MKTTFKKDFFDTRDGVLEDIKNSQHEWNKFICYWANILDEYSVDNVLNLYSYTVLWTGIKKTYYLPTIIL